MSSSAEFGSSSGPLPGKTRKWASDDDFNRHRNLITELYQTSTLSDLMQTMESEHKFFATPKMYKTRFRRWGLWKHNQASTVVEIIRLKREREAQHKPTTEILLNGRRVDLARIDSYLRRNDKMRRYVSSLAPPSPSTSATSPSPSATSTTRSTLIVRTPSPSPAPTPPPCPPASLLAEESLYHAIRTYYASAFHSHRWAFSPPPPGSSERELTAAAATASHIALGQQLWVRFRSALNHLQSPSPDTRPAKRRQDLALGVRLLRIAFAELTSTLLSGYASPLLPFWVLHVAVLFHEARLAPEFQAIGSQLLRHVAELTAVNAGPGSEFWRVLWSNGRGPSWDRWHVRRCAEVAGEEFDAALGETHAVRVNLGLMGVLGGMGAGTGDAEEKSREYAKLLGRLAEEEFDARHMDVLACWAVHLRQHRRFEEVEELMHREVLQRPERMARLHVDLGGAFNLHILLAVSNIDMERYSSAESYCRQALDIARMQWQATQDDGDLFEGLDTLERCLRAQDKQAEAEAVVVERQAVVKMTLERVGEKEDSV